jgi:DNA-binding transcriptional ArsR family regulator
MTVGEATGDFGVSKPAVSRHLRVLEEAGAIVRVIDGRTHRLRLAGTGLTEAQTWMARQRALWERKFDVVEHYLAEQRELD